MRYRLAYVFFVLLSLLDLGLTCYILGGELGRELNPIADLIVRRYELFGLIVFKLAMIVLIILLCESIGSRRDDLGRFISRLSVVITSVPVVLSSYQLVAYAQ
mgnify:CR=1 FL=1